MQHRPGEVSQLEERHEDVDSGEWRAERLHLHHFLQAGEKLLLVGRPVAHAAEREHQFLDHLRTRKRTPPLSSKGLRAPGMQPRLRRPPPHLTVQVLRLLHQEVSDGVQQLRLPQTVASNVFGNQRHRVRRHAVHLLRQFFCGDTSHDQLLSGNSKQIWHSVQKLNYTSGRFFSSFADDTDKTTESESEYFINPQGKFPKIIEKYA